jgi:hypothetical protein
MLRHILISSVAVGMLAFTTVASDASPRGEGVRSRVGTLGHRSVHRVHVKRPYRQVVPPAAPADPWAEWCARWTREVGNCPCGWSCYPLGNM